MVQSHSSTADDDDQEAQQHSTWRIALYYIYIDLSSNGNKQLEGQIELHQKLCEQRDLKGRIRISPEGINGVLSGKFQLLQEYEQLVTQILQEISGNTINLNVKYCLLREDLPIQPQLFDNLIVKKTQTVISLFGADESFGGEDVNGAKLSKKAKAKRKKNALIDNTAVEEKHESIIVEEGTTHQLNMAKIQKDMTCLHPSPHLTPDEWNSHLLLAGGDKENNTNALLLDVRNVYESRVGHFSAPNVPTLLTNTRKYSDLPHLLANNPHIQEKSDIYMYCTGGVRCERVSMLVQSLYPEKRVYQLGGGIQTYLEAQASSAHSATTSSNLFLGKNFVFDPRRTDPVHGPAAIIGRCLVCAKLHDDYDNGHAPSEQKEARCNTCRMLILICNDCRPNYVCFGEALSSNGCSEKRPLLYCGLEKCVHEGAAPAPELVEPPTSTNIS